MLISTILKDKGAAIYSAKPSQTLEEAARILREKRIGAVLVTDDFRDIVGVLSERDIVTAIAQEGAGVVTRPVSDFMTRHVISVEIDDTIEELMDIMTNKRIRHVPVMEHGRLAGVISIGDVVKHRIAQSEMETEMLKNYIAAN